MPRIVHDKETKRRAVADWLSGKKSAKQLQEELGVSSGGLSNWKKAIAKEDKAAAKRGPLSKEKRAIIAGASADAVAAAPPPPEQINMLPVPAPSAPKRTRSGFDDERAKAVARDYHGGMTAAQCATKYSISVATVYTYKKRYPKDGAAALTKPAPSRKGGAQPWPVPDAGVRDAMLLIRKALGKVNTKHCPHCGGEYVAKPPSYSECLTILAHYSLEGED